MSLASPGSLRRVLVAFGLPEPADWVLLRRSAVKRDEMVRVAFSAPHAPALVRFHDPKYYRRSDIEHQTRLRSHLSALGVPVPRLHTAINGDLFIVVTMHEEDWPVTVEDWVDGEPPQAVTFPLISGMGRTLAAMHAAASGSGVDFGHGTGMSLFTDDDQYARNAARVRAISAQTDIEQERLTLLFGSWDRARGRLREMWPNLPAGPVHADFAEYNLLLDRTEDIAAVIDFNLAGDDVFVNELVHACLRLPSSGEEDRDRDNWKAFITAYESVRTLSVQERLAVPYLVTVVRPFRSREVSPLFRAAEKGDGETVARGISRLARLAGVESLIAV